VTALIFLTLLAQSVNYDESKVGAYTLPNPLMLQDGEIIRTSSAWEQLRRPEILKLFETNMYGRVAPAARQIAANFTIVDQDRHALGGKAVRKQVTLALPSQTLTMLIYLPVSSKRVPVFLALNFTGNETILPDPAIRLSEIWDPKTKTHHTASEQSRGSSTQWQVEKMLARGYGLATIYYQEIEPDFPGGIEQGVRAPYPQPAPDQWGAIGAWAWGMSRALDYLLTDADIDPQRVIAMGHSRLGKTALWAAAQDRRFAMVIAAGSGEGGAALSRRDFGETIELVNEKFPHWTCENYKKYSGHADRLPFDQHELLALIAPRPLYLAAAEDDKWADPKGEFLAAVAASPVYILFGKQGLEGDHLPALNKPIMNTIGFHIRPGKHEVTAYDWDQFLTFADHH
jgi:hypothetical protein